MAREFSVDPSLFAHLSPEGSERDPRLDDVVDAVEALPEIERAVVELILWGCMSKVEVARELGVSRSYVHKVFRRAKERLACRLASF